MTRGDEDSAPLSAAEAIARRRTARRFDPDRPLSESLLIRLLELATLAPSRFNLQPWRFVVVRDARNRKRLRRCAYGEARITEAPVVLIVLAYLRPHVTDLDEVADRLIASGATTEDEAARVRATAVRILGRGGELAPESWAIRAAERASTTLRIAAAGFGVASAGVENFDEGQVREAFGVPDDHAVCGIVALGYAAEEAPFPGRFGLDRACFAEHFGQPWETGD